MPRYKLGRTKAHREATIKNLVTALIQYEAVTTTVAKAKETQRWTDRMMRIGKQPTLAARRALLAWFPDRRAAKKILEVLAARYQERPSGYTRLIRLHPRKGDGAFEARVELLEAAQVVGPVEIATSTDSGEVLKSKTKKVSVRRRTKSTPGPSRKKGSA